MSVARIVPTLDAEQQLIAEGANYVIGLDEVGRGSLAGPVMVGAAVVDAASSSRLSVPYGLADSKMLTPAAREGMVESLKAWSCVWATGVASNQEIDQWGIMYALGLAGLRALEAVEQSLQLRANSLSEGGQPIQISAILDGSYDYITPASCMVEAPNLPLMPRVMTHVKADATCAIVSCASVIAKVARDSLMVELSQKNPQYAPYDWEHNKGYASAKHRQAIAELGVTPYHRKSWHLS